MNYNYLKKGKMNLFLFIIFSFKMEIIVMVCLFDRLKTYDNVVLFRGGSNFSLERSVFLLRFN